MSTSENNNQGDTGSSGSQDQSTRIAGAVATVFRRYSILSIIRHRLTTPPYART